MTSSNDHQFPDVKKDTKKIPTKLRKSNSSRRSPRSSSTPASSELSLWYLNNEEEEEDQAEDEERELMDNLYDTDNESMQEDEPVYLQQAPLVESIDFFDVFGNVPDIGDISEDIPILEMPSNDQIEEDVSHDPNMQLSPPLTGDIISSSQLKLATNSETPPNIPADTHAEATDISEETSEISDIYGDFELTDEAFEEDAATAKVADAEEALEIFLELETKKQLVIEEEIDFTLLAKEEEAKRVQKSIITFVHDLIRSVVEIVEYISPNDILRNNLDKRKLMQELQKKTKDLEVEKSIRIFLNRKIIEFYKRKKTFRPILPDSVKSVDLEKCKYKYAIERLDILLAKESNEIEFTARRTEDLRHELSEATGRAQTEVQQFEEMVRKHLIRDTRPKCNALIDKLLLQMCQCRQEVTDIRFEFLMRQHTQATLMDKIDRMEDLGNGLTMKNFGNLQTETQTMGKKIEERNVDLNKLHIRVRNDIHLIAHYKEKQKMLRNSVAVQRMALEELLDENRIWREKIHRLKIERGRIRQQISDLSFKGGLLDKPALMWDYDQTCEKVEERRDLVNYLREIQQSLQMKLEDMMKQFSASMTLSI